MVKSLPIYAILGILAIITFYAGFTGKRILFVSDPRSAVIVLTVIGFIMCSMGTLGVFLAKAPAHPLTIIGYTLGSLALITGIVQVFRFKVPILSNPNSALFLIAVVIVIKFVIGRLSFLLPVK